MDILSPHHSADPLTLQIARSGCIAVEAIKYLCHVSVTLPVVIFPTVSAIPIHKHSDTPNSLIFCLRSYDYLPTRMCVCAERVFVFVCVCMCVCVCVCVCLVWCGVVCVCVCLYEWFVCVCVFV